MVNFLIPVTQFRNAVRLLFIKFAFKNIYQFLCIKEIKKSNGMQCFDVQDECDASTGLLCLGEVDSKKCGLVKFYLNFKIFRLNYFFGALTYNHCIFKIFSCKSSQFFDISADSPTCSEY